MWIKVTCLSRKKKLDPNDFTNELTDEDFENKIRVCKYRFKREGNCKKS